MEQKTFCQFCGKEVPADVNFCPACGRKIEPAVASDAEPMVESLSSAVPATPTSVPTSTSTPAAEPVKGKVTNAEVEKMLKEEGSIWKQIITVVIFLAIVGLLLYLRYEREHKEAEKAHEKLEVFMEKYR